MHGPFGYVEGNVGMGLVLCGPKVPPSQRQSAPMMPGAGGSVSTISSVVGFFNIICYLRLPVTLPTLCKKLQCNETFSDVENCIKTVTASL